jgi:hypothetical protein
MTKISCPILPLQSNRELKAFARLLRDSTEAGLLGEAVEAFEVKEGLLQGL